MVAEVWQQFKNEITNKTSSDIQQRIYDRELIKAGDTIVSIRLKSEFEVNILTRFEQELVSYLKKNLNNDFITLEKVVHEEKSVAVPYSSTDKYAYMVNKNPALKLLVEKLGMDYNV